MLVTVSVGCPFGDPSNINIHVARLSDLGGGEGMASLQRGIRQATRTKVPKPKSLGLQKEMLSRSKRV